MRAFIFTLVCVLMSVCNVHSQTNVLEIPIDVKLKNATLEELLLKIESVSDVKFNYVASLLPPNKQKYVFKKVPLAILLSQVLKPHQLTYTLMFGNSIVISPIQTSRKIGVFSGYVSDVNTGEKLINAFVIDLMTLQSTYTNEDGYYSLSLKEDSIKLMVAYVGYENQYKSVIWSKNQKIDFKLKGNFELDNQRISAYYPVDMKFKSDEFVIHSSTLKKIPMLFGESDVLKSLQLLPGVIAGNDGTIGLNVRGGGNEHNLFLLDDVPIYNPSHIYGFFSIFNSDVVKQVKLLKGGNSARYGGRLSSVIDIRTIDGNKERLKTQLSIGVLSSKISVDGPINKSKKTTLMFSARRSYLDLFTNLLNVANVFPTNSRYFFYDINAKISHQFSANHHVSISAYTGNDVSFINNEFSIKSPTQNLKEKDRQSIFWGNSLFSIRDYHLLHPKVSAWLNLAITNYEFGNGSEYQYEETRNNTIIENKFENRFVSNINDVITSYNVQYNVNSYLKIKSGLGFTRHAFARNIRSSTNAVNVPDFFESSNQFSFEYSAYSELHLQLRSNLDLNAGVYYAAFVTKNNVFNLPQPRLSVNYEPFPKFYLHYAYQRTSQFLHLLTNYSVGLPLDLWLPSTNKALPEFADLHSTGLKYSGVKGFEFGIESFAKKLYNVIDYKDQSSYLGSETNWEDKITIGNGMTRGLEFMVEKTKGKTSGWISYTLSKNTRQFNEINQGKPFLYKYDRRHQLSVLINHRFSSQVDCFVSWVYASGARITLPEEIYTVNNGISLSEVFVYGERNKYQMPANHRLDFSFNFKKNRKKYTRIFSAGVYNAYNRLNPFYVIPAFNVEGNRVFKAVSLFPVLPSVNYKIVF
jgi:hypothetical protein